MSKYTKHIIVWVIFFGITIGAVVFFQNRTLFPVSQSQPEQRVPVPPQEGQIGTNVDVTQFSTYHDPKYHFRIEYPAYLEVRPSISKDAVAVYSVSFGEPNGMWVIGVMIKPTSFHTPEELVAKEMQSEFYKSVIDRSTSVEGYHGVVIHYVEEGREGLESDILFIKDGFLYTISDRTPDYKSERVLRSFHFE